MGEKEDEGVKRREEKKGEEQKLINGSMKRGGGVPTCVAGVHPAVIPAVNGNCYC